MALALASISPADAATKVLAEQLVRANLTYSGSSPLTEVETLTADFAAGTLVNTEAVGDELRLAEGYVASNAAEFNGSSSYGTLADSSNLDFLTSDITLEAWINPDTVSKSPQNPIFGQYTDTNNWIVFGIWSDGKIGVQVRTGGTYRITVIGSTALVAGTLYHVAVVIDRDSAAGCKVYINGESDTLSSNTTSTTSINLASVPYVGRFSTTYYDGKIDEFRFWKVIRTQQEIQDNMRVELTGSESNLVGYWKFNEGTGTSVDDSSANSNTCTLTNCSWVTLAWLGGGGFQTSGTRVSPAIDLTSVGLAGARRISWDVTLPTGTSLTIKSSITSASGPWSTCTNGGTIPDIVVGADLTGVDLWLKAELATTDTDVTPHLTEIRIEFTPIDPEDVSIEVNGVEYTLANGGLIYWGHKIISGGVLVEEWDDLWFETTGAPRWFNASLSDIAVSVAYEGTVVDSTTFTTDFIESFWEDVPGFWEAWTTSPEWRSLDLEGYFYVVDYAVELGEMSGYWYVLDFPPLGFDGYFWVAHPIYEDLVSADIVGEPVQQNIPSSIVVEGWNRFDVVTSTVAQAWMRIDHSYSTIVGIPILKDACFWSAICGILSIAVVPWSTRVFQVNARNLIQVNTITAATEAFYALHGITFTEPAQ